MRDNIDELVADWRDGHIKQTLITRVLEMRRLRPELFAEGEYEPLAIDGKHSDRVIAFRRRLKNSMAMIVAPRTVMKMLRPGGILLDEAKLVDTYVALPRPLLSMFDREAVYEGERVPVAQLLRRMPFAFLVSEDLC
jgi:(1->4)-alpha-D-glucan 1-alpha-D-glucosylmutase